MVEMDVRCVPNQGHVERMNTRELREAFLVEELFVAGVLRLSYWDMDRMILGSAVPTQEPILLGSPKRLLCDYFTEYRELGVANIGAPGSVCVNGQEYRLDKKDVLYIGKGNQDIQFASDNAENPAQFYLASYPAHKEYPTTRLKQQESTILDYGSPETVNKRDIHCYFMEDGLQSCQLMMGITDLKVGSVWNTMPPHLHLTRSEAYLYFDTDPESVVFHFMGEPQETRHIAVKDRQVVFSPHWSVHTGVSTRNYSFLWAMGGEDKKVLEIDGIHPADLQ